MTNPTLFWISFARKSHCQRAKRGPQSPPQVPVFSREIAAFAPLPRDVLGLLISYKPELAKEQRPKPELAKEQRPFFALYNAPKW